MGTESTEVAVRTRWPEKPYTVYDYADGRDHGDLAGHAGPEEDLCETSWTGPVRRA